MKRVMELFIQTLLWLQIALSPCLVGALLGFAFCVVQDEITAEPILILAGIGFVVGAIWAEYIRRTRGLLAFSARLVGGPSKKGTYDA